MIDAYEQKHGPVDDRSIFSGDIVVPPHLRNISLVNSRPNRLHGGLLGSLSRSRTFLSLSSNPRQSFCGSVPDLSRTNGSSSSSSSSPYFSNIKSMHNVQPKIGGSPGGRSGSSHPGSPSMNVGGNRQTMPPIRKLLTATDDIELRINPDENQYRPRNNSDRQTLATTAISNTNPIMYGDKKFQSSSGRPSPSPSRDSSKGYMALIRTNHTNSLPNRHTSSSALRSMSPRYDVAMSNGDYSKASLRSPLSSDVFQLTPNSFSTPYANELSLDVLSKYTIPRVSLRHTSPLVSPNSERKFDNYDAMGLKKEPKSKYEEDVSAA